MHLLWRALLTHGREVKLKFRLLGLRSLLDRLLYNLNRRGLLPLSRSLSSIVETVKVQWRDDGFHHRAFVLRHLRVSTWLRMMRTDSTSSLKEVCRSVAQIGFSLDLIRFIIFFFLVRVLIAYIRLISLERMVPTSTIVGVWVKTVQDSAAFQLMRDGVHHRANRRIVSVK